VVPGFRLARIAMAAQVRYNEKIGLGECGYIACEYGTGAREAVELVWGISHDVSEGFLVRVPILVGARRVTHMSSSVG
jgi:hypothetical protein